MKRMTATKAKAQFLAMMKDVALTGEPVVVTNHGKPLVRIIREKPAKNEPFIGRLEGIIEVRGDLLKPAVPPEDWDQD